MNSNFPQSEITIETPLSFSEENAVNGAASRKQISIYLDKIVVCLGISGRAYREALSQAFGVSSSGNLSWDQIKTVLIVLSEKISGGIESRATDVEFSESIQCAVSEDLTHKV